MTETARGPPACQVDYCNREAHFRTGYTHCLEHDDPITAYDWGAEPPTAGIATDEFTFYFGASCGSSRKTLRQLEEPNVLLSYATKNNSTWDSIESFMVDSGGYSLLVKGDGEYTTPLGDYCNYIANHDVDYFMTRDVPLTDRVLSNFDSATTAQARSIELTIDTVEAANDRGLDGQPLAVLQGTSPQEYIDCYHELVRADAVTQRMAVGSLKDYDPAHTATIITRVREAVDDSIELHGLGVEAPTLAYPAVRNALASADSSRYIATARWRGNRDEHPPRLRDDEPQSGWMTTARAFIDMRAELREVLAGDADATHEQAEFAVTA